MMYPEIKIKTAKRFRQTSIYICMYTYMQTDCMTNPSIESA